MKRKKRESHIISGFKKAVLVASAPSYYPEKKRKSYFRRLGENLHWLFTRRCANTHYNLYGFDAADFDKASEYLDYVVFKSDQRNFNITEDETSQVALLRDKFLFYHYMKTFNMPVPDVFAILRDGNLFDAELCDMEEKELTARSDYFIKAVAGIKGANIRHIKTFTEYEATKPERTTGNYLLQDRVYQHSRMNELNPGAVNTVRVVTVTPPNSAPVALATLLRMGTSRTGAVDNWSAGGIAIGIEADGTLKKYGLYHMCNTGKTDRHPDTGIVFGDFRIPYYEEALELACRAQKYFYAVHSVGWDIAITEAGPVIIEGNDNYGLSFMQACDRPLRKEWEAVMGRL